MRIVAGVARGRRLAVPAHGTRPTSDRVREALFSSLAALAGEWAGTRVLDLYAGSGALGLEALSRGAVEATMVERERAAAAVLRRNVETVGLSGASVVVEPVEVFAARSGGAAVDRVLVDPPYDVPSAQLADVLGALLAHGRVAAGSWAVVERSRRTAEPPWPDSVGSGPAWTAVRERAYGDTTLWYGHVV